MKVILTDDVLHLGRMGDIREVAPGYARNFLLPRNLVISATPKNMAQVEHQRRQIETRVAERRTATEGVAAGMQNLAVEVSMKVGAGGKLFGSVTNRDILATLADQGHVLDRHALTLAHPIKALGEYAVELDLGYGVKVPVQVSVVSDAPADEAVMETSTDAPEVAPDDAMEDIAEDVAEDIAEDFVVDTAIDAEDAVADDADDAEAVADPDGDKPAAG